MNPLTTYQKLVLRLLCAILWRMVNKIYFDAKCVKDIGNRHGDLIDEARHEIDRK